MAEETLNTEELGEKIVRVLKTIFDPEIPVDIYELGLIYDVFVSYTFFLFFCKTVSMCWRC